MTTDKYILGPDHVPIPEPDLMTWAGWFETADRRVARTELADGAIEVSTVFLGLDHSFGSGVRRLFETMVFYHHPTDSRRSDDAPMERYPTWATAEAGHARIVEQVRAGLHRESA